MSTANFKIALIGLSLTLVALIGLVSAGNYSESISSQVGGTIKDHENGSQPSTANEGQEHEGLIKVECVISNVHWTDAFVTFEYESKSDAEKKVIIQKAYVKACEICCGDEHRTYKRFALENTNQCYCFMPK